MAGQVAPTGPGAVGASRRGCSALLPLILLGTLDLEREGAVLQQPLDPRADVTSGDALVVRALRDVVRALHLADHGVTGAAFIDEDDVRCRRRGAAVAQSPATRLATVAAQARILFMVYLSCVGWGAGTDLPASGQQ